MWKNTTTEQKAKEKQLTFLTFPSKTVVMIVQYNYNKNNNSFLTYK